MQSNFVVSVITADKPGIIEILSSIINKNKGNWLASNFTRLSGQFAGIVEFSCPTNFSSEIEQDLNRLQSKGFQLHLAKGEEHHHDTVKTVSLSIIGNDKLGIINEISRVLAEHHVNLLKLESSCEPAPNWGGQLFKAAATLELSEDIDFDLIQEAIEDIANDLIVEVEFQVPG